MDRADTVVESNWRTTRAKITHNDPVTSGIHHSGSPPSARSSTGVPTRSGSCMPDPFLGGRDLLRALDELLIVDRARFVQLVQAGRLVVRPKRPARRGP